MRQNPPHRSIRLAVTLPTISRGMDGTLILAQVDGCAGPRAGEQAGYPDAEYAAKGAKIVADRAEVFRSADLVVPVLGHGANDKTGQADLKLLRRDQLLVAFLRPLGSRESVEQMAAHGVTAFAVELMPRTTRAQSMEGAIISILKEGRALNKQRVVTERKQPGWVARTQPLTGAAVPARPPTRSTKGKEGPCGRQWTARATAEGTRVLVPVS